MFIFDLLCAKHVIMEVKIKYEDIISYCEKLSSFEADRKVDANGESRYLELHINEVDKQLIQQYIVQARAILEERMERMIKDIKKLPPEHAIPFDFISSIIPDNKVDLLDDRSPVAYFTNGNAFAYYQETNIGVYDVQYIDIDDPKYGYDGSPYGTVYWCKEEEKLYAWNQTQEGLEEYIAEDYGFIWSIRTTTRWNGIKTFTKHIHEAIASYVMSAWLKGKLDDRVPFYEGLFSTTLSSAVKNLFTKQAPKYE